MTFLLTLAKYLAIKAQITLFIAKNVKILIKYLKFSDFFLKKKSFNIIKDNHLKLLCYQALKKLATIL